MNVPQDEIEKWIPGPSDEAVGSWLEGRLEPFPGLSLERLRQGPILAPGTQEIAWSDLVFATQTGKIELLSEEAGARWGADPLPTYAPNIERPATGNADGYPLQLLTPNTKNRIHSQFGNLPSIRALDPDTFAEMSPADAAARGIVDGDPASVFNDRGRVEVKVRLDHSLRPGCVVIHNGWWLSEGGGINLLSAARETDMGHGAAFHDNAVEVELVR